MFRMWGVTNYSAIWGSLGKAVKEAREVKALGQDSRLRTCVRELEQALMHRQKDMQKYADKRERERERELCKETMSMPGASTRDAVPTHVLRISSAMHVGTVGSDGTVPTANVATALTVLQDNSMSTSRPVFANARKLFKNFFNKFKTLP